jgi:peptidyl-prolyl cis-trans isomerase B (cyclophilin B)
MNKVKISMALAVLGALMVAGCDEAKKEDATPASSTTTSSGSAAQASTDPKSADGFDSSLVDSQRETPEAEATANITSADDRKPKDGEEVAVLETGMGKIILMFFPDKAPNHVKNFKTLVTKGFYNGTKFHRTVPGFMIQGGDPNTKKDNRDLWGTGGPGYQVKAEFNNIHHAKGILSMARSQDPDSAGSQFFIMVGDAPFLDTQYTAFGKVVKGQDVADKIVSQPTEGEMAVKPVAIKKASIVKWPVK